MSHGAGPGKKGGAGTRPGRPGGSARYGYPFDPFPILGGARPVYALSANVVASSGGNFASSPNLGTYGGTWEVGASNNAPRVTTNELGLRPSLDFDQANSEAIHTSDHTALSSPFTVVMVADPTNETTAVWVGASENGATNTHQIWESGTNMNVNNGATISGAQPAGLFDRDYFVAVIENSGSYPLLASGEDGTIVAAGAAGTAGADGFSLGSNNVPETTNTFSGDIGYFAVWPSALDYTTGDLAALLAKLVTFYDLTGA